MIKKWSKFVSTRWTHVIWCWDQNITGSLVDVMAADAMAPCAALSSDGSLSSTRIHMMTSSNGNIFRVNGPLCGEFTGPSEFPTQRPMTRSFDVFFDLRLNKRLSKQPWGWWFETPSWSLWRQCNDFHVRQSNSLLQWLSVNAYLVCQKLYECIWYISNGDNEVLVYGLTTQSREVAQGIHFTVKAVPVIERYRSEKMAPQ